MNMTGRRIRVLAVAMAVVGAIAACGGDGGESESTTSPAGADQAEGSTLTAAEVVDRLQTAGLPIGTVTAYDEASDPNGLLGRPGQYTGKSVFIDTRLEASAGSVTGVEAGGDVESFDSEQALSDRANYLSAFADEPPLGGWYQYEAGNVILRVSFDLTPDQAAQYDAALQDIFDD